MIEHRQPTISHCPECGYCLTGLPARHRCPECGLAYDEHTQVWQPKNRTTIYGALLLGSVGICFQLFIFSLKWIRSGLHGWIDGLMCLCIFLGVAAVAWRLYRVFVANQRGRFAAVTPAGLVIRSVGDAVTVPWGHIREASHWVSSASYLTITLEDDTHQKTIDSLFSRWRNVEGIHEIVSQHDRDAFVAAVNEAIQRHRDAAAAPAMA